MKPVDITWKCKHYNIMEEVLYPDHELYLLLLGFLAGSPCREAFEALREEVEQKGLLGWRTNDAGGHSSVTYEDMRRIWPAAGDPNHLRRLLDMLLRLSYHQEPAETRTLTPAWTLVRTGALSLAPHAMMRGSGISEDRDGSAATRAARSSEGSSLRAKQVIPPPPASREWNCAVRAPLPPLTELVSSRRVPLSSLTRDARGATAALAARELGIRVISHKRPPRYLFARTATSSCASSGVAGMRISNSICGHVNAVYCCTFDRSGQLLISGSDDTNVKIWSVASGLLRHTLRGHMGEITEIAVSPSNECVVSASNDCTARVWRLQDGAALAVLRGHEIAVNSIVFSPMLRLPWMLSIGQDASVLLWQLNHWERPVKLCERSSGGASCCAAGPTGRFAAVGVSEPPFLYVWQVEGEGLSKEGEWKVAGGGVSGHAHEVTNVSFSKCGRWLLSGSRDGSARIWRLERGTTPRFERKLVAGEADQPPIHRSAAEAHSGARPLALWVDMVAWNADDTAILTSESLRKQTREETCVASCLRVWSRRGALLHTLNSSEHPVFVLQPHPLDPHVFASAGYDGVVRTWDGRLGTSLAALPAAERQESAALIVPPSDMLLDASWSADGTVLAVGCLSGSILLATAYADARLEAAPSEQFFASDFAALIHDLQGNAVDLESQQPVHLLPRGLLCDVSLVPLAAAWQQPPATLLLEPRSLASEQRALVSLDASLMRQPQVNSTAIVPLTRPTASTSPLDTAIVVRSRPQARGGPSSMRTSRPMASRQLLVDAFHQVPQSESDEESESSEWRPGADEKERDERVLSSSASSSEADLESFDEASSDDSGDERRGRRHHGRRERSLRRRSERRSKPVDGWSSDRERRRSRHSKRSAHQRDRLSRRSKAKARRSFQQDSDDAFEQALQARAPEVKKPATNDRKASAWLERSEARLNEYVPQVGDIVVYLRRGHQEALKQLPDPPDLPQPPFALQKLPFAVGCEVIRVRCLPPHRKASQHVRLLVTLRVRENPLGSLTDEMRSARAATRRPAAPPDEWEVVVHAAAAGSTDYLVLRDRYEHALRQYEICRQNGRCAVRMMWLQNNEEVWYRGQVVKVGGSRNDLWCSLKVEWEAEPMNEDESTAAHFVARPLLMAAASTSHSTSGQALALTDGTRGEPSIEGDAPPQRESDGRSRGALLTSDGPSTSLEEEGGADGEAEEQSDDEDEKDIDNISPWEVEVYGMSPFTPSGLPAAEAVGIYNNLEEISHLELVGQLEEAIHARPSKRAAARALEGSELFIGVDLKLILLRLGHGYYRQWESVQADIELLLARYASTPYLEAAEKLRPVLHVASAQSADERSSWKAIYESLGLTSALCGEAAPALETTEAPPNGELVADAQHASREEANGAKIEPAYDEVMGSPDVMPQRSGLRRLRRAVLNDDGDSSEPKQEDDSESDEPRGRRATTSTRRSERSSAHQKSETASHQHNSCRYSTRNTAAESNTPQADASSSKDPCSNEVHDAANASTHKSPRPSLRIKLRLNKDGLWSRQRSPAAQQAGAACPGSGTSACNDQSIGESRPHGKRELTGNGSSSDVKRSRHQ